MYAVCIRGVPARVLGGSQELLWAARGATKACMTCDNGVAFYNTGFVSVDTSPSPALVGPLALFECPLDGCIGQETSNITTASRPSGGCLSGYTGALCSVCSTGFARSGSKCEDCSGSDSYTRLGIIVGCAIVAAATYGSVKYFRRSHSSTKQSSEANSPNAGGGVLPGLLSGKSADGGIVEEARDELVEIVSGGGYMVQGKILIGLLQMVTELPSTLRITFPQAFADVLDACKVFLLDVFDSK